MEWAIVIGRHVVYKSSISIIEHNVVGVQVTTYKNYH